MAVERLWPSALEALPSASPRPGSRRRPESARSLPLRLSPARRLHRGGICVALIRSSLLSCEGGVMSADGKAVAIVTMKGQKDKGQRVKRENTGSSSLSLCVLTLICGLRAAQPYAAFDSGASEAALEPEGELGEVSPTAFSSAPLMRPGIAPPASGAPRRTAASLPL